MTASHSYINMCVVMHDNSNLKYFKFSLFPTIPLITEPKISKSQFSTKRGERRGGTISNSEKNDQNIFSFKNDAKFIILKNSR